MKVLYHHRTRGRGAEAVHIRSIVNAFRELGHEVEILSYPGADPYADFKSLDKTSTKKAGVLFSVLAAITRHLPEWAFELAEILYNVMAISRLNKSLDQQKYDFIYERYSLFLMAGVWVAKRRNIPIILEINDSVLVERVRPLSLRAIGKMFEKYIWTRATGLVFISDHFKTVGEKAYGKFPKAVVSPNAADPKIFDPAAHDRNQIKAELGLAGKVVCGYVGAFVYWHGLDRFVREFAKHAASMPNLCMLLVGDGVQYEDIKTISKELNLEDRIKLTGRVPHVEVSKYLCAMDIGFLPDTEQYTSPLKLFEFMSMGLAVVTPAYGPACEVVHEKQNGMLFKPKDFDSCIEQIRYLYENDSQRENIGVAARKYIIESRQWTHNVKDLLSML